MLKHLKRCLSYIICLAMILGIFSLIPTPLSATSRLTLTDSGAWFETAYAQWSKYNGASSYNVYYKLSSSNTYTKVDAELVRGTRVDIPGLKGNTNYTIKIVPVVSNKEVTSAAASFTVTPAAHDRSGYAFFNGKTTGGYNADGSVPSNANIIYVTEQTKDTVKLNGYTGIANILSEAARKNDTTPLIVRFIGSVSVPKGATAYPDNMLKIKAATNVTLEGIGPDANIAAWGLWFQKCSNIEIRNLDFYWYPEDAIGFEADSSRVWIHNNNIRIGHQDNPRESDKAHGDGGTDFKYTDYVTVSYNHYQGAKKTSLCGLKENKTYRLTFHHNYFDQTGSRTPRVRYFDIHMYNNYYNGISTYGIGASVNSNIFSENNYFENTNRPMVISMQGNGGTTFSSENGGTIKAYGNKIVNCTNYKPGVDYYEASSRDEIIKFSANKGGSTYNNFDTNASKFYKNNYILHTADEAKQLVLKYAGRMKGKVVDSIITPGDNNSDGNTGSNDNNSSDNTGSDNNNDSSALNSVKMGTYPLNNKTIPSKICTVSNMQFNVRSVESDNVKLRSSNQITFKISSSCTLQTTAEKANLKLTTANGSITYNNKTSTSTTIATGIQSMTLTAGTYTIQGAESGSNSLLSKLVFE